MNLLRLSALSACLLVSFNALSLEWKNECVGYYQLALPDNLEVALYPVKDFVDPDKEPASDGDIETQRYASPKINFEGNSFVRNEGSVQAQFTQFYYGKYELGVSSKSLSSIDFPAYQERVKDDFDFWRNVKKNISCSGLNC